MQQKQQRRTNGFSRFSGVEDARQDDEPSSPRFACVADGCPVTAAMSVGDRFVCRYHDGQPASSWAGITTRIRNRTRILEIAERCASSNELPEGWHEKAAMAMEAIGRHDLVPAEIEGRNRHEAQWPRLYAQRLFAVLVHEVMADVKKESAGYAKHKASWRKASEIVGNREGEERGGDIGGEIGEDGKEHCEVGDVGYGYEDEVEEQRPRDEDDFTSW